jgi:hypothetical protein
MKAKKRWSELLLPWVAALVVLVAAAVQTANAGYVEDTYTDEYATEPYYRSTSTSTEFGTASASADDLGGGAGVCDCSVTVHAWAETDTAWADADAYAWWLIDWTWDGPPPATGGTLEWLYWTFGEPTAYGFNTFEEPETEGADTASRTDSNTQAYGTSVAAYVVSWALGSVQDSDGGEADTYCDWEPEYALYGDEPHEDVNVGDYWYSATVEWELMTEDEEEDIASGTTYVYLGGYLSCATDASANSSKVGANSDAYGVGDAFVCIIGSFTHD